MRDKLFETLLKLGDVREEMAQKHRVLDFPSKTGLCW